MRNFSFKERLHMNNLQQADYRRLSHPEDPARGIIHGVLGSLLGWCIIGGGVYVFLAVFT